MKEIIILLGVPGSGKGTEAMLMQERLGYTHISTGDLLRALDQDPDAPIEYKQKLIAMKNGQLVANDLIYTLAFNAIKKSLAEGKGVVLDGAIRTVDQAKEYKKFFEKENIKNVLAIEITIDDDTSYKRLSKRKLCPDCGNIIRYSPDNHLIKDCPKCGGTLIIRADDSEEVIRKRILEQGNEKQKPIVDFYREEGILKTIDGMNTIEWIYEEIEKILTN